MRDNLTEIIEQYLKIETNYALIVNGNYGIGKTYFVKNELFTKIKEISLPHNNEKNYTPIHISLFGIKTIEDLQTQIFVGIYPILKKRGIKLAAGIGKSLIRGIAQLNGFGDIKDYLNDFDLAPKDWINYDELVLCLDDIDRKSESLSITETLGFINTLVENYGAKILIIANEDVLRIEKNYSSKLREKVIGISVEFVPKSEQVFDLIIAERYSSDYLPYFNFLNENKHTIIDIIQKNDNNLRNLIYFLEHFRIVFSNLIIQFQEDTDFNISKTKKLTDVLYFSLTVAFEYKAGNLNSSNLNKIQNADTLIFLNFNQLSSITKKDEKPVEKSYEIQFIEKYYSKIEFVFFNSIFKFLTGQSAFIIDELIRELKKIYIVEDGNIPESQKLLTKLGYFECLKLTDNEYKISTYEMLEYVDKGEFLLDQHPTAFLFATRFDNVLQLNIQKLKKRFKSGIDNGVYKYQYDRHFRFRISLSEETEFKEHITEIMNYCISKNKKLEENIEENNFDNLILLLSTNMEKFIESLYNPNNQYHTNPFWTKLPINKVYQIVNKLNKIDIIELSFFFKERYKRYIISTLYPEKEFLKNLQEIINRPQKRKVKNLRNAALDILIKQIEISISNFDN